MLEEVNSCGVFVQLYGVIWDEKEETEYTK